MTPAPALEHVVLAGGPARLEIVDVAPGAREFTTPYGDGIDRELRGQVFVRTRAVDGELGLPVFRHHAGAMAE